MPQGTIVKALSGFYYVSVDGKTIACRARGKFRKMVCLRWLVMLLPLPQQMGLAR